MAKNQNINFRAEKAEKEQILAHAKAKGFDHLSAYLRDLVAQDMNPTTKERLDSLNPASPQANHLGQEDVLLAVLELNRKVDRYWGLTYKTTKVRSQYEKLRNAVLAMGMYQNNPEKLKEYFAGLFQGEMEVGEK